MRERARCVGCGRLSPETETNYTLISSQFGWRLTRFRNEQGKFVVEWRCPTCWKQFKETRRPEDGSRPPPPGSNPPPGTSRSVRPPPASTPMPSARDAIRTPGPVSSPFARPPVQPATRPTPMPPPAAPFPRKPAR